VGLVKFLLEPFLESPESLKIDWEPVLNHQRVWIRIAFDSTDKGKVFGRGGRNIQAIRKVIAAAAATAGQSVYLDIYGGNTVTEREDSPGEEGEEEEKLPPPKLKLRGGNGSKPIVKPPSR
jgi:predicted RNA-binding protein YlqC (UPF0109 family)